jgi:hypothetical protein
LTSYTNADVCAFTKEMGTDKIFVASNLRNASITFTLPAGVANNTWTNAMTGVTSTQPSQFNLQPYSYVILKK